MRVKFLQPYFAANFECKLKDGRTVKGVRYRAGIYDDVPDDLPLPKSAVVLAGTDSIAEGQLGPKLGGRNPLHQFDLARAAGEQEDEALAEAEQQRIQPAKRGPGRPRKYTDI